MGYGLRPGAYGQFHEYALYVRLYGFGRDSERPSDALIREPLADLAQNIPLAMGQRIVYAVMLFREILGTKSAPARDNAVNNGQQFPI